MTDSIALFSKNYKLYISIFLIWLVNLSGMIGICLGHKDWFLPKTPFNLVLCTLLLIWNFPPKNGWKSFSIWTIAYLTGMIAEGLGANYGLIFGDYTYGENLGLKVFSVPLLIGINWVILTFSTAYISRLILKTRLLSSISGAILMVIMDVILEPIAPVLDFWYWHPHASSAPLQNFIAWFIIGFALQMLCFKELPKQRNLLPLHLYISQILFFILFYGIYAF